MQTNIKLGSHDLTLLMRILEASEGLAILKTIDGHSGCAQVIYPATNARDVNDLLIHFSHEHTITIID